jgi:FtsZ-interacting cell division protein ZipA
MSDLQISLLVIGVAIVAGVVAFNWMQERRFRKQADAAFRSPMDDALMQRGGSALRETTERVEPALHEPLFEAALSDAVGEAGTRPEAVPELRVEVAHPPSPAPVPETPPPVAARTLTPSTAPYDELIEYRIRLGGENVPASVFSEALSHARTLGKPVRWLGLPVGATEWEDILPWRDARYQQMVITMQLSDRNGAVQEEQLSALCELLQRLAQTNGLRIACDDVVDALERAQAVDRFCVDVDVLIGLNVVARGEGAVNLTRIVHEAESSGMVLGVDGVYQLLDSRGEPLYALCNHDAEPFSAEVVEGQATQGVTLQFDVPRVPDGLKVFDGMVGFGRKIANEIGGILVDDNLRPLTDAGIEKIRTQLMQIYERMEARGVPSGSRRALRLFS